MSFFVFLMLFINNALGQTDDQKIWKYQVQRDTIELNDMIDDMYGYEKKKQLINLIQEYKSYQEDSYEGLSDTKELHTSYIRLGETLLELAPEYDSTLHNQLEILKNDYKNVESEKVYDSLQKRFEKLKREYKKNEPNTFEILQAFKRESQEDISLGDAFKEIGGILIEMDEYAERFGELNNLSSEQIKGLKLDPAGFISLVTYQNGNKYWALAKAKQDLKRGMDSLQNKHNIITTHNQKEYDQLAKEYKILKVQKKALKNQFEIERQHSNQEKEQLKAKLAEYERLIDLKSNEYVAFSTEIDELKIDLAYSQDTLFSAKSDLENTKHSKTKLQSKIDFLSKKKAAIEKEKQTLADGKERAENTRTLFLLTSMALLMVLLGYLLHERWHLQKEKNILDKNLKYKEGFYRDYMLTSKAEIAIQREKLKEAQKQINTEREKLRRQNIVMLRELNHRTKNNLQTVSSILGIQALSIDNEKARDILLSNKSRIHAIGLIHKGMYTQAFDKQINVKMKNYVDSLIDSLKKSFQYGAEVEIEKEVDDILVQPDKALPIGLIISEVVNNAFKHAFPGHPNPKMRIELKHIGDDQLRVTIYDNGKGMSDVKIRKDSFGLKMIQLLTRELEGTHQFESDNGLKFTMTFPHKQPVEPQYD